MIEFDVLSERPDGGGRLLLAHEPRQLRDPGRAPLEEALRHLASARFAGIELDVDLRRPGYELRVLDALRQAGLVERALVSTGRLGSLDILRAAEPRVRLGWSAPRLRHELTTDALTDVPGLALLSGYRARFPSIAADVLAAGRCDAVMAHWRLVTPRLVRTVHEARAEVYVWTVDSAARIARLAALGVDGVISNDPRLFG